MNKPDYGEPWEIAIEELDEDCKTIHIPQIDRVLHDSEWAEPEEYQRDLRNAKRIVACVNACTGLSDQDLKAVPHVGELLEALKAVMVMSNSTKPRKLDEALTWVANDEKAFRMATEALAKAEGRE